MIAPKKPSKTAAILVFVTLSLKKYYTDEYK